MSTKPHDQKYLPYYYILVEGLSRSQWLHRDTKKRILRCVTVTYVRTAQDANMVLNKESLPKREQMYLFQEVRLMELDTVNHQFRDTHNCIYCWLAKTSSVVLTISAWFEPMYPGPAKSANIFLTSNFDLWYPCKPSTKINNY